MTQPFRFRHTFAAPISAALIVISLTAITVLASGPNGTPPNGNVDANFNSVTATATITAAIGNLGDLVITANTITNQDGKPVTVIDSQGFAVGPYTGNTGNIEFKVDGNTGAISNPDPSGKPVVVADTQGLKIGNDAGTSGIGILSVGDYTTAVDFTAPLAFPASGTTMLSLFNLPGTGGIAVNGNVYATGMVIRDPNSGIFLDSANGGITLTTVNGGETIYSSGGGGLTVNTKTGGFTLSKNDGTLPGTAMVTMDSGTGGVITKGSVTATDGVNSAVLSKNGQVAATGNIFSTDGVNTAVLSANGSITASGHVKAAQGYGSIYKKTGSATSIPATSFGSTGTLSCNNTSTDRVVGCGIDYSTSGKVVEAGETVSNNYSCAPGAYNVSNTSQNATPYVLCLDPNGASW